VDINQIMQLLST